MEGYHEIESLNDRLLNESLETEENLNEENNTGPRITGTNFLIIFRKVFLLTLGVRLGFVFL